jgi:pimeloyl-ACP methyl ester carboxylesterase
MPISFQYPPVLAMVAICGPILLNAQEVSISTCSIKMDEEQVVVYIPSGIASDVQEFNWDVDGRRVGSSARRIILDHSRSEIGSLLVTSRDLRGNIVCEGTIFFEAPPPLPLIDADREQSSDVSYSHDSSPAGFDPMTSFSFISTGTVPSPLNSAAASQHLWQVPNSFTPWQLQLDVDSRALRGMNLIPDVRPAWLYTNSILQNGTTRLPRSSPGLDSTLTHHNFSEWNSYDNDSISPINAGLAITKDYIRNKFAPNPIFDKPGIRVFFATEREALTNDGTKYGPHRDPNMLVRYGTAVVEISEKPGLLDPDELRIYRDQNYRRGLSPPLDESAFYAAMREEIVRSAPDSKQVFIFIHGFNNSFEEEINKTAEIAYDTRFVGVPILFDWPSGTYGGKDIVPGYNNDFRSALESVDQLAKFLKDLSRNPGVSRVNIIAHSMGSYLLLEALDRLQVANQLPHFGQLILAAPDIPEVKFKQVITKLTAAKVFEHITLYGSRNDYAMWASEQATTRSPVGMLNPIVNFVGLDQVDASKLTQNGVGHDYIVSARAVMRDMYEVLKETFTAPPRMALTKEQVSPTFFIWELSSAR